MKYFTIDELTRSATAKARGIDNTPTKEVVANLTALTEKVLDPLREAWGRPLTVNSGYRCPALNKAVNGAATSQHMTGQAADITTGNAADNRRLYQLAVDLKLPFDQLIGKNYNFGWLHLSYDPKRNRRQVF